ncbi:TIGR02452 family protein [Brevibacillus sp. SYSU BS000544]|uniref:TIGR02452 family protein n=1 Tax=Brevibacillus sp. SYSU BS000544 TaxID=3416443 RepID=UPI003CE5B7AD
MNNQNSRMKRAQIAQETLKIIDTGTYVNHAGRRIELKSELDSAINSTVLYRPTDLDYRLEDLSKKRQSQSNEPFIEITSESTLGAAKRLVVDENIRETVCLNFASAKNPGGGFLNGSQAQEESLARSSGLYPCISQMQEMYDYNKKVGTGLYSDYMIYSPNVPVFRNDNDILLNLPYFVSFITAPAVNAGIVREREPRNQARIDQVMIERIKKILSVASSHNHRAIVLGAYGCGVFQNKLEDVSGYFRNILLEQGYGQLFDRIVFAIYDHSPNKERINVFKKALRNKS